jgi:hypothetical protein
MILGEVFERFARDCPLPVMARATLENALNPRIVDQLFDDVADKQYTRKLLFSSVVDLMGLVVCRIRPAIHSAYQARAEIIDASLRAVYDKLDRTEPAIAAALVRSTAQRLDPVITAMAGARPELLPGYRTLILDGNHLAGTEHRIKELRSIGAGALPGQALVILDPSTMLAIDVIPCEDGHAQERSLLDAVLETLKARDLLIQDRNFCTTGFLFGIARRGASFVVRQHAATLHWELSGKRRARGRVETGKVFEQAMRLTDPESGEVLMVRRITVVLDRPTRDGDAEIQVLTNLPAADAKARAIADLYRARWTIESAFAELEATLEGEVATLGYPKAALLAFCVALASYNILSTVKAALRSVHGDTKVSGEVSGYYVAEEVTMTQRGMMIAIPEDEWVEFREMAPLELAGVLMELARAVRLPAYRKHPRGPKVPQPKRQSGEKIKHVATSKILSERQKRTR